jgi:hypothetical protein
MSEFVFLYRGDAGRSPERMQQSMQKWMAWFKGLGERAHINDRGQPPKSPTRMSPCFVRHCPKLSAMTRNFPRGAFLSMSFVTLFLPALCYFHQLQNTQNQDWVEVPR